MRSINWLYEESLKKDDKKIKKVYLNYPPGEVKLCDLCDEEKPCASITFICGDVAIICKDCLTDILKEFDNE
jgi:hypothetical protein